MRRRITGTQRARAGAMAFVVAVWACLATVPAMAQVADVDRYVTAAARLYEDLEYERALEQLQRARKLSRGVDDDVTISLYEGIILADLGRQEQSTAAFKEGLYLKPDAKLPIRVSPKVSRAFEDLRAEVKKELAPILAKRKAAEDAKAEQERARAEQAKRDQSKRDAEAKAKSNSTGSAPAEDRPTRETHVIDALPDGSPDTASGGLASAGVIEKPGSGPPVLPLALGGVAVAAAGVGGYFGLQSRSEIDAARASTFRSDAEAHLQAAQTPALVANVLFATAVTAAAGAVITLITGSSADQSPAAPQTR